MTFARRRWGPALAVFVAAACLAVPASAPGAGWSRPFVLGGPAALDVIPPQIAFAPDGSAAIAFGVQDVDQPARSTAEVTLRSAGGHVARARRVPQAQAVLDLAYAGGALELLTGTSPRKYPCCSTAQVVRLAHGRFGGSQRVVSGLTGTAVGRLVALSGRTLAALATERGVWAATSVNGGAFGAAKRIDAARALPESLDAAQGSANQGVLAWTAASSRYGPGPRSISIASGFPPRAPSRALTVPAGHRIDELALVHAASGATVAWIESWFDRFGSYHSVAMVADLLTRARRQVSSAGAFASGLAFAGDGAGAQALAWRECSSAGTCVAKLALRAAARGRFRGAQQLGAVDPGQAPAVAVGPRGAMTVGWISAGQVHAAAGNAGRAGAGAPVLLDAAPYGADLALAYGPRGGALAAWIEGTFRQTVLGASYH